MPSGDARSAGSAGSQEPDEPHEADEPDEPHEADEPHVLSVREGFRLWAPTYGVTPLSELEERTFRRLVSTLRGARVLDAGAGTGRRIDPADEGAALWVALDLVREMLAPERTGDSGRAAAPPGRAGPGARGPGGERPGRDVRRRPVVGDLRALPFPDAGFDVVVCRLVLAFVPELSRVLGELARVLRSGGTLVLTDLHPAGAGGQTRSFRDRAGVLRAVEHRAHPVRTQIEAAERAGLALEARDDLRVGPAVRDAFGDRDEVFEALEGRPVVLGLRFRRDGEP